MRIGERSTIVDRRIVGADGERILAGRSDGQKLSGWGVRPDASGSVRKGRASERISCRP
jgi:hypothetical protein